MTPREVVMNAVSGANAIEPLHARIGEGLASDAPPGWRKLTAWFEIVNHTIVWQAVARVNEEPVSLASVSQKTLDCMFQLQRAMVAPRTGTWIGATVTIWADGRMQLDFNYDEAPQMHPADADGLREELRSHPRAADTIPAWWPTPDGPKPFAPRFQTWFGPDGTDWTNVRARTTPVGSQLRDVTASALRSRGLPSTQGSDDGSDGDTYEFLEVTSTCGTFGIAFFEGAVFLGADSSSDVVPEDQIELMWQDGRAISEVISQTTGWPIDVASAPEELLRAPGAHL